jgi:hypothetical protein
MDRTAGFGSVLKRLAVIAVRYHDGMIPFG